MREDWVEIELGELCKFSQGVQVPKGKQYNGNNENRVRFLRIIDFTQGKDEPRYIDKPNDINIVAKDDISMVRYGATTGFVCSGISGAIANNIFRIIPEISISKRYLYFFFKSPIFYQTINSRIKGAAMPAISFGLIKPIICPLPPLVEQKAIVKKIEELFSSLDSAIADLKKAQDQLVIYRQAVLKKAFEGGYTQPNEKKEELVINGLQSVIPQNWKVCKVGEIAKLQGGFAFKSAEFTDSGIPIVKIKNVHYQDIDWSDKTFVSSSRMEEFNSYSLNKGDVLIAMTRPVIKALNNIKTVVVKESDLPALLNQRVGRFVIKDELDKNFLKYFIFTDFFKRRVLKESSSSQQPNISSTKIEKFDFILPETTQEQHQIVQEIESRLSVCDKVEESIIESLKKAKALRQSILKKAFEGKLLSAVEIEKCKQHKDYEPASVLLERIKKEKS